MASTSPVAKLRRSFYETSKIVFNAEKTHSIGWFEAFQIFVLVYSIRVLFIVYFMAANFPPTFYNYHRYDFWLHFFSLHTDRYDSNLVLIVTFFEVFYFTCEFAVYKLNTRTITWRWWYQLVVENEDWYYECKLAGAPLEKKYQTKQHLLVRQMNRNLVLSALVPDLIKQLIAKRLAPLLVFFKLEDIDRERYLAKPLSIMPHLSAHIRQLTIVTMIVCDYFFYFALIVVVTLWWLVVILNIIYYPDWSLHPWFAILWANLEQLLVFFIFIRILRYAQFFVVINILATIHYAGHAIEMRRLVERTIKQTEKAKESSISLTKKWLIELHLREHNKVCYLVVCGSIDLFGSIMYTFLLTNIPINIYIVSWVIFKKHQLPLDRAIIWIFSFAQMSIVFAIFLPLAWCCEVYHSPAKFIPKLQLLMSGSHQQWRLLKLKYDDLLNRLLSGPMIAVSIGFRFNPVTYWTFFEFLYAYIAYLLMGFSQMLEHNTKS